MGDQFLQPPLVYADDAFLKLFSDTAFRTPRKKTNNGLGSIPVIYRLTEGSACKFVSAHSNEIPAPLQGVVMHLVSSQTTIPVPHVNRILAVQGEKDGYLDMEYIEGVDLDEVWPTASWWTRLKIIWTLRGYIRQLRRFQPPFPGTPGPISPGGRPYACLGAAAFGDDGIGPFATYDDFASHFDMMRAISLNHPKVASIPAFQIRDCFDKSWPLVLTHGDIHLKNVRMGTDGKLWLLDWGSSGIYPIWFESMNLANQYAHPCPPAPRSFTWFYWLMAGWFPRQARFMDTVHLGIWLTDTIGWRYDLRDAYTHHRVAVRVPASCRQDLSN